MAKIDFQKILGGIVKNGKVVFEDGKSRVPEVCKLVFWCGSLIIHFFNGSNETKVEVKVPDNGWRETVSELVTTLKKLGFNAHKEEAKLWSLEYLLKKIKSSKK